MRKNKAFMRSERGQSIVIIAAAMIGLLALAGLAIDGGNMFLQRRRAQNAADSGALAGTRILAELVITCQDGDSEDDARVAAAVTELVSTNGFSSSNGSTITAWYVDKDSQRLGVVGGLDGGAADADDDDGGGIPESATGVEVQLGASFPTYFLKAVGIENGTVGTEATAMTGRILQFDGGMLPIGIPQDSVDDIGFGTPFQVFEQDGRFCRAPDGECSGDINDPDSQRGWLNLNYIYNVEHRAAGDGLNRACLRTVSNAGCNATPPGLAGYTTQDCPYRRGIFAGDEGRMNGDFIHGSPGGRNSSVQSVYDSWPIGSILYAPVFDAIYESDDVAAMGDPFFPPDTPDSPDYCNLGGHPWPTSGDYLYHIVGWVAFSLQDPLTRDGDGHGAPIGIQGTFTNRVIAAGQIGPDDGIGGACESSVMYGVNLWE
jgi:hypothetical protein